jgi:hypothetical protein
MTIITRVVCSFTALFIAGVLCGVLAYLVNPHFLSAIHTKPWTNICCLMIVAVAGVAEAQCIQMFGDLFMPSNQYGPWYTNPIGGAFLLVALILLTIFAFPTSMCFLRPIIPLTSLSSLGALFQLLAITLLDLAFTIGLRGASARQNLPPPLASSNRPPSKPSRHLTHDRD